MNARAVMFVCALAMAPLGSAVAATADAPKSNACFFARSWQGWKAPDGQDPLPSGRSARCVQGRSAGRVVLPAGPRSAPDQPRARRRRHDLFAAGPGSAGLQRVRRHPAAAGQVHRQADAEQIAAIPKKFLP
ncbi:MAG: hypothetical protein WDN45_16875 [Caulobacteraceae bacterium]